jgi:hypothetical protein
VALEKHLAHSGAEKQALPAGQSSPRFGVIYI